MRPWNLTAWGPASRPRPAERAERAERAVWAEWSAVSKTVLARRFLRRERRVRLRRRRMARDVEEPLRSQPVSWLRRKADGVFPVEQRPLRDAVSSFDSSLQEELSPP